MCFWPFVCYVHAFNTTDKDTMARRKHQYASRCCQCLKRLTPQNHVAGHVVAYPCCCLNCCVGILTLKTVCKKCNNRNRRGKSLCLSRHGWFFLTPCCAMECKLERWLRIVTQCNCRHMYLET
jgi:hypothetical protein